MDAAQKERELAEYQRDMTWLRKYRKGGWSWRDALEESGVSPRQVWMFGARFSLLLGLSIDCDGCGTRLKRGQWYRCMQCTDCDFCTTCLTSKRAACT